MNKRQLYAFIVMLVVMFTNFGSIQAIEGKIAFTNHSDLYLMKADGSRVYKRTENADPSGFHAQIAWSPDGCFLAYKSQTDGNSSITVICDTSCWTKTLFRGSGSVDWSHDSKCIVYNDRWNDIYKYCVTDEEDAHLYNWWEYVYLHNPVFSPDDSLIGFIHHRWGSGVRFYFMDSDGGNPHYFAGPSSSHNEELYLQWWPFRSRTLLFKVRHRGIYVLEANTGAYIKVLNDTADVFLVSPDGARCAYIKKNRKLFLVDTEHWSPYLLTEFSSDVEDFDWSPSGDALACMLRDGIYIVPITGADSFKVYDGDCYGAIAWGVGPLHSVQVSIPRIFGYPDDTLVVPIMTDYVEGKTDICSYGVRLCADTTLLIVDSVYSTGTTTESWGQPTYNVMDSCLVIAGAGAMPITESGILVYVKYRVNPSALLCDTCSLRLTEVLLNECNPPSVIYDGQFKVLCGDIECDTTVSPSEDSVAQGYACYPQAVIRNNGIDTVYNLPIACNVETSTVKKEESSQSYWTHAETLAFIPPAEIDTVTFDSLFIFEYSDKYYVFTVFHTFPGDTVAENDTTYKTVYTTVSVNETIDVSNPGFPLLYQNQPNPFTTKTNITYYLPTEDRITLQIYAITGKLVKVLVEEERQTGFCKVSWDGRDKHGKLVSPGIYFYQLTAKGIQSTKKMIILR